MTAPMPNDILIAHIIYAQKDIGWHILPPGWVSIEWDYLQQVRYNTLQSRHTGVKNLWILKSSY
jgi:hypothetical protein